MSDGVKLEACPFCGGDLVKTFGPYGWYCQWGISHSCSAFYNGTSDMFKGFATEAEAIAAWNTRKSDDGWRTMESAPKDGTKAWVKRVCDGRIIKEGWAVFDYPHHDSPMLKPIGPDPLNRLSAGDYAREAEAAASAAVTKRWLNLDRMHAFPEPTAWRPSPPKEGKF